MSRTINKWQALKPGYRRRLERRGVTQEYYLSGGNLAAARGHSKTPEKPSLANPTKYPEYVAKRLLGVPALRDIAASNLTAEIENAIERGQLTFENRKKLDLTHMTNVYDPKTTEADLAKLTTITYGELADRARKDSLAGKKHSIYYYHGWDRDF